jgi:hypothetical protein
MANIGVGETGADDTGADDAGNTGVGDTAAGGKGKDAARIDGAGMACTGMACAGVDATGGGDAGKPGVDTMVKALSSRSITTTNTATAPTSAPKAAALRVSAALRRKRIVGAR